MRRIPRSELSLALLLVTGCLAPRPGSEGQTIGLDELGRMIGEAAGDEKER